MLIFVSMSVCFLPGCDCVQRAKGLVFDKTTRKPLDSVYVHKIGKDYGTYSDSTGNFEVRAIDGGLFGCPIFKVAFAKKGYWTVAKEFSGDTSTIYLKRMPDK